jgi:SAM-dependent methyltransferase
MNDSWAGGRAYDRFMGRWSSLIARQFLDWLNIEEGARWLDVGCGTGTLTRLILERYEPKAITGIDASPEFLALARTNIIHPAVKFQTGLAQSLELPAGGMDAVVSGLVLNFVPDPAAALREMKRVARPGGTIGVFVWDYAEGMQMLRHFWDAAVELDPGAIDLDEGPRFPVCRAGQLEALAHECGLEEVRARAIETETVFQDFEDYWEPFLGGAGPGSAYTLGLEEKSREKLREKLRERLPAEEDGKIKLRARAWAAAGQA